MPDEITTYIDRHGNAAEPGEDAVIGTREGEFAVFSWNGKILLISPKKAPGVLELPGGGIDPGEDAMTALYREIAEETGFSLTGITIDDSHAQRVGYFADDAGENGEFWAYSMRFHLIDASPIARMHFEGARITPEQGAMRWVAADSLDSVTVIATHRDPIRRLLKLP